ncbi:hypothetical protein PAPYR_354 [Paratrimastix pyriformis]|uniref:EF-hand domain-containing protein n=1 Tax=Paratrimastix pyriformis TaxID=342808 RepID=A0ABQ8UVH4_9EUKA|nr:hypothetical protein PAPYR_354 [Paratrimastix pyriformis]
MQRLQVAQSEAELEQIIDEIDEDGSGEIDPQEFIAGFRSKGKCKYDANTVKRSFHAFAARPGRITTKEIESALKTYCQDRTTPEEITMLSKVLARDQLREDVDYESLIDMNLTS